MKRLRDWSVPLIVAVILVVGAGRYGLSTWTSGGWRTAVNLTGGLLITVLGVSLAGRLMMRHADE